MSYTETEKAEYLFTAALEKVLKKRKDLYKDVEHEIKAEMLDEYVSSGTKNKELRFNGAAVGTLSVRKPSKKKSDDSLYISDWKSLKEWADDSAEFNDFLRAHFEKLVCDYYLKTGKIPDGCEVRRSNIQPQPTVAISVEPKEVAFALRAQLPDVSKLLSEGENHG